MVGPMERFTKTNGEGTQERCIIPPLLLPLPMTAYLGRMLTMRLFECPWRQLPCTPQTLGAYEFSRSWPVEHVLPILSNRTRNLVDPRRTLAKPSLPPLSNPRPRQTRRPQRALMHPFLLHAVTRHTPSKVV